MDVREAPNSVASMREDFERDGFVVIPGALPPEQVATLTAKVDKIWDEERTDRPVSGAKALHLLAFCGREPEFLEMLDPPNTLPLVVDLIGTNIFMFHCHLDVHPPEPRLQLLDLEVLARGNRTAASLRPPQVDEAAELGREIVFDDRAHRLRPESFFALRE